MDVSLTDMYRLFDCIYQNVKTSMGITDEMLLTEDKRAYITQRSLIIFKLDSVLFKFKQENDWHRFVLRGRNALNAYLFFKYKVPYSEAKSLSLMEALAILMPELNVLKTDNEIVEHLSKSKDFIFHVNDRLPEVKKVIIDDLEWDAELCDRLFLK